MKLNYQSDEENQQSQVRSTTASQEQTQVQSQEQNQRSQSFNVQETQNSQPKTADDSTKKKSGGFRRLFSYTLNEKKLLFLGLFGLLVSSTASLSIPYFIGDIIDTIAKQQSLSALNTKAFYFIGLTLIASTFTLLRGSCFNLLGERVLLKVRRDIFDSFIRKDTEFFDVNKSGELVSRISSDCATLQQATSESISMFLREFVAFLGSFTLLWIIQWDLTLGMMAIIPPLLIFLVFYFKRSKEYAKKYQDALAVANSIANEAISNVRVIKSFGNEKKETANFKREMDQVYGIGAKKAILQAGQMSIFSLVGFSTILGVLWYGGYLVLEGKLSLGKLSSFVLYTFNMCTSVLMSGAIMNQVIVAIGVSEKLFDLIDTPEKIKSGTYKQERRLEGAIKFEQVVFEYPTKKDVQVLKGIDLEIKQGQTVALVGSSGSGKSSIVSLIQRFYDPKSGSVQIDNKDIREFDWEWFHQNIGYVSQEPTLFSNSLKENIVYGINEFTDEDINNAMRMANAYDFVNNKEQFPEGLNTIVGERGVKLSGGQKQRVAIARALIKNPSILIFDEATSALDAESEYQVQQAIDGLVQKGNKTILIIAHRLSTIINCDKILVLDEGQIKEQGDHKTLLQMNGIYKKLIERQLAGLSDSLDQ